MIAGGSEVMGKDKRKCGGTGGTGSPLTKILLDILKQNMPTQTLWITRFLTFSIPLELGIQATGVHIPYLKCITKIGNGLFNSPVPRQVRYRRDILLPPGPSAMRDR
jgi:hypothetical protein